MMQSQLSSSVTTSVKQSEYVLCDNGNLSETEFQQSFSRDVFLGKQKCNKLDSHIRILSGCDSWHDK